MCLGDQTEALLLKYYYRASEGSIIVRQVKSRMVRVGLITAGEKRLFMWDVHRLLTPAYVLNEESWCSFK